jgi:hypothetical protein
MAEFLIGVHVLIIIFQSIVLTDTCANENSANLGFIGAKDINVMTLSDCHYGCMTRNWCAGYNYHKQFLYCDVLESLSGATQLDPYFITGTKTCGNNGSG